MNAKTEGVALGLDRLNALLSWWGISNDTGNENIEVQMKRFQVFASDLQKAYGDAYCLQMEALFTANERLGRSFQEFLHCRQPQEVIAAESSILATILERASLQAKPWIDLTEKVQDCCAALAREGAEEGYKQAKKKTEAKPAPRPVQASNADAAKHLVRA
jgi:hypothetical protein